MELQSIAARKGVSLPSALDSDHEKTLEDLTKHRGADFDKEYANAMVEDHEQDIAEFKGAAADLKDPDVRAWVVKTLPALQMHLQMAKEMKAKSLASIR